MPEKITAEQISKAIEDFEDETGAVLLWRITCAEFGTGSGATAALCEHLAARLNDLQELRPS